MNEAEHDGRSTIVWTASAQEQYSYLVARFGPPGRWSVRSQSIVQADSGDARERVEIDVSGDDPAIVEFVAIDDDDSLTGPRDDDRTGFLDDVIGTAATFAEANPPHHPGSLARFPVPSSSYANALSVAMPVMATDDRARGLFSPPRVVVLAFPNLAPIGVGEFPGFDPESWPPDRLGQWPPASMTGLPAEQIQATIERFSACWYRILEAWFARADAPVEWLAADIGDALAARSKLDGGLLEAAYVRLNPVFARWLERGGR